MTQELKFKAKGSGLQWTNPCKVVADSQNYVQATFDCDAAWNGLAILAVFSFSGDGQEYSSALIENSCYLPWEILQEGWIGVALHGYDLEQNIIIYTGRVIVPVSPSGKPTDAIAPNPPTPPVYAEMLQAAIDAALAATDAAELAGGAAQQAGQAAYDAGQAAGSAQQAAQALSDALALMGEPSGIATLGTDGKLLNIQLPALSITDVFDVPTVEAMLELEAQTGDVARIIPADTVTDSYILAAEDPTDLNNWKKIGVSYVAEAGHATSADSAADSSKINGKRLVGMTQTQYDIAYSSGTLDPEAYYAVIPDEEGED